MFFRKQQRWVTSWSQGEPGDGSEDAPQGVPKYDTPLITEAAQVPADLCNNLMKLVVPNEAGSFVRIMQNGSWAVGLQVSESLK